jgi:hypothetical protein
MTHPAIAEDGILISSDVLHKFAYKTYETRVVEWGAKKFPLNLYGTAFNFKAFPDIGEFLGCVPSAIITLVCIPQSFRRNALKQSPDCYLHSMPICLKQWKRFRILK